jgi:ketosteroid isomerase-like protein
MKCAAFICAFASRWVHTWTLRDGKIAAFDDAYDSLAVANAVAGVNQHANLAASV